MLLAIPRVWPIGPPPLVLEHWALHQAGLVRSAAVVYALYTISPEALWFAPRFI